MHRELARKSPAHIVNRLPGPALPRHETIVRRTKEEVLAELKVLARKHEIGSAYALEQAGQVWALKVTRIKEPGRRWWPWWKTAGFLAGFAGLGWLVVLVLKALALALAVVLPYLLAAVALLAALLGLASLTGSGGSIVEVLQKVTIKR
jgi:hypothetical protein